MTRALIWHWKTVVIGVLAVGLIAGLTLGILLSPSQSAYAQAEDIARNSLEVQQALGSEVVEVLGVEVRDDQALVMCTTNNTGGVVVCVVVDLSDKEVTKVTYEPVGKPFLPDPEMESQVLQTTTDKLWYELDEEVAIEITNISPETITGGGVYYAVYDLEGNLIAGNGLFLAFEWEPGEGLRGGFTWDLTNPEDGKLVHAGTYVILGQAGDYTDGTLIHVG